MKKLTVLLFIIYVINISNIFSQTYGWFTQTSGVSNNLTNVKFFNSNIGTVVGQNGKILRTTNGGTNWISQTSGTPNHLFGVHFFNQNTGWAVGDIGIILYTTNGGTTWVTQTSNTFYQLRSIVFLNQTTGFAVGWYGVILKTTNSGTNWLVLNTGTSNNLLGISFPNTTTGFAIGWNGTIIKTTNSGTNWTSTPSGTSNTLEDVTFFNATTGLIVGEGGRVQRTTDGGVSWTAQTSGIGTWVSGITSPHSNYSTMAGELGMVRTTFNGGVNWYPQVSNTGNWINKISCTDTLNGWGVGDYGTIIHTTTGGWLPPPAATLSAPANNATCVSLTPNMTWTSIFPPYCNYRIQISLTNTFTTTVIDSSGTLYTNFNVPANKLLNATPYFWRVCATNQVATGPWSTIRSFTTINATPLAPVLVAPPNNSQNEPPTTLLNWDSVANASSFRVRVSADSTFATSLIDTSGLNISQYRIPAGKLQNNIKYYWRVNASNSCVSSAWSQTWSFRVLITSISSNENEIPKVFKLYDNYPNPFNPVTKIKFDLPATGLVKLKLFDITGKEVANPINNELKAGTYEYIYNAVNLSSGVYFYKIETNDFSDIKRMVLIK